MTIQGNHLTMATPANKITPVNETVIDALSGILQHVPEDDEDEIGIKRVAFIASLLDKADDDLFRWAQSTTVASPDVAAPRLRTEMDIAGAIAALSSELQNNKNKIGGRMLDAINLINGDRDHKDQLFQVLPQDRNTEDLDVTVRNAVIKVGKCLSHAKAVPTRINAKLNATRG